MSLRWRLALIVAVVVAVTVGLASVGAYVATATELHNSTDRFLAERSKQLVEEVQRRPGGRGGPGGPGRGPGERPFRTPYDQPDALVQYVTASGRDGSSNVGTDLPVNPVDLDVAGGRRGATYQDIVLDGEPHRMLTTPVNGGGALQVARDVSASQEVLSGLRTRLFLLGAAGTIVAAAIGWLVARHTVRPVERLTAATESIAATQELSATIAVDRDDELGRLAASFNAMVQALQDTRIQQQRLVQDASHELRTPLTSLRTNIEVLASADRLDPHDRQQLMADVGAELVELTDLVNELVVLAQYSSPADEQPTEVRLDDVVAAAVERCRRRTGRRIELRSAPTTVLARPAELDRAVANLLNNAAKFSPSATPIEVVVHDGQLAVRDHGPGITDADKPHVLERFYRSDAARSAPGSGLGLAIVDQVVRASGGSVFVEDAPGGGALVGFTLPPAPNGNGAHAGPDIPPPPIG